LARLTGLPLVKVLGQSLGMLRRTRRRDFATPEANPLLAAGLAADGAALNLHHPWIEEALDHAPPGKLLQVCHLVELQRHHDRTGRGEALDEVHPFISQPMIETSLATGAHLFAPGGVRRGLQRRVFRDLIPASVYARRGKSATTSRIIRALRQNSTFVRETLLEGGLAKRGILSRAAVEARLETDATDTMTAVFDITTPLIVELWVQDATTFLADCRLAWRETVPSSTADSDITAGGVT
jgi:asparagine synthase (glutamine-hydrolysing)